jgi:pyruvate-formate lyase-activating enzyme
VSEAQVVFFGAGEYAKEVFDAASQKYAPVAYGDNDTAKHGASFMGLPVLSLGQLEARHPGCRFYLTVHECNRLYVMESLISKGIDRSRIVNFEEYKRYKSCWHLENYMLLTGDHSSLALSHCCSDFGRNKAQRVRFESNAHEVTMQRFFALRDSTIEELNLPSGAQNPCMGCRSVKEGLWRADRRLRVLNYSHGSFCNFGCSYCRLVREPIDESFTACVEKALEFLRFIKNKAMLDAVTEVHIATGEISIHPLRDKILMELWDNPCWIYTNASVYSEKVGEMLSRGKSSLHPSIDAGTRGTFAIIKGVDLFDRVCENLARYSLDGPVHLRYIVLPGVNDNERDVAGFIDLCGRLKIRVVNISRDSFDMTPFGDHTIETIARMLNEMQKMGVKASAMDIVFSGTPGDQRRIEERLAELRSASAATCRQPPGSGA